MKDNIPKKSLDELYELNALSMAEVDEAKKNFNENAMRNKEQSNALLNLHIQELETELDQVKKERNTFEHSYEEEKERNVDLIQSLIDFNKMVDDHLTHVIEELETFDKENASFLETFAIRMKMKRLKKRTKGYLNINKSLRIVKKVEHNET